MNILSKYGKLPHHDLLLPNNLMFFFFLFAAASTQTLLKDLRDKIGDSSVSDFLKTEAIGLGGSHGVREKAGFVFKHLNQPDDYPENEFICYSLFCALGIEGLIAETICVDERGKFFPINQSALAFLSDSSLHGRFPALRLVKEEGEKRRIQVSRKVGERTLEDRIKPRPALEQLFQVCEKKKKEGKNFPALYALKKIMESKIAPEDYFCHFIMALLLNLGDAKAANYVIGKNVNLIAIDNEMILRDAVVYYTARGPLCGLQSVLLFPSFREKFVTGEPQTVDQKVIETIKTFNPITPEEIFNVLEWLMSSSPTFQIPDNTQSVLYIWCKKILEYNDTYKFLDSYDPIQRSKSREELWWKLFEFSNRWNKIAEKLKEDISYDDLFKHLHLDLFDCYKKAEEEQGENPYNACQHLIYHQLASGLKHKGKEQLRRKLCTEFFEELGKSAKKFGKKLVKQKIPLAQFILGLMHEKTNSAKSVELYISAAQEDGCFYAQNRLCEILSSENASRDEDRKKIDGFLASIEDSTQNSQFLYLRGQNYENKKNKDKAVSCYKKSAEMPNLCAKDRTGNYHAQHRLGEIYKKQDKKIEAVACYTRAAKVGHWDSQIKLFELSLSPKWEDLIKKEDGEKYLESALKQGYPINLKEKEWEKWGDTETVISLLRKYAGKNHVATYVLAEIYEEQDKKVEAVACYTRTAKVGHWDSQIKLWELSLSPKWEYLIKKEDGEKYLESALKQGYPINLKEKEWGKWGDDETVISLLRKYAGENHLATYVLTSLLLKKIKPIEDENLKEFKEQMQEPIDLLNKSAKFCKKARDEKNELSHFFWERSEYWKKESKNKQLSKNAQFKAREKVRTFLELAMKIDNIYAKFSYNKRMENQINYPEFIDQYAKALLSYDKNPKFTADIKGRFKKLCMEKVETFEKEQSDEEAIILYGQLRDFSNSYKNKDPFIQAIRNMMGRLKRLAKKVENSSKNLLPQFVQNESFLEPLDKNRFFILTQKKFTRKHFLKNGFRRY